jgi:hypothetical protein
MVEYGVPAALEGGENTKDDAEENGEDTVEERHLDITLHHHQQTSYKAFFYLFWGDGWPSLRETGG